MHQCFYPNLQRGCCCSLISKQCFVDHCLTFCAFSLTIVLSVLLRFVVSDLHLSVFKLFLKIMVWPFVPFPLAIVLSVLRITTTDYPFDIFKHFVPGYYRVYCMEYFSFYPLRPLLCLFTKRSLYFAFSKLKPCRVC